LHGDGLEDAARGLLPDSGGSSRKNH
jgi:hypothetical protein